MTFIDKAEKYIIEKELIDRGDRVICALSGGGDSVALLHTLKALEDKLNFTLLSAHFNHGIRGAEADRDEAFSRKLSEKLGVPFFSAKEDIPAIAKEQGIGLEECARNQRYAFLFRTAKEQNCNKIATAHHATDNTETVLFHLIRGTGINGLSGIAPKREDGVIRPLLSVSRQEIDEYLLKNSLQFVTDSTNADTDVTRNFIRLKILPLLDQLNSATDRSVKRLSDSAREDEDFFLKEAKKIPRHASLTMLSEIPAPVLKRYLRLKFLAASRSGAQLDHAKMTDVCRDIRKGKKNFRYSLPGGIAIVAQSDKLDFILDKYVPEPFEIFIKEAGEYPTENGSVLLTESESELTEWEKRNANNGRTVYRIAYPYEGTFKGITARSRREGDKYVRGKLRRTVRKELNAAGYPAHKRIALPHFCDADGIFWIPPLKAGDKVSEKAVQKSKQLIYIGYTEN